MDTLHILSAYCMSRFKCFVCGIMLCLCFVLCFALMLCFSLAIYFTCFLLLIRFYFEIEKHLLKLLIVTICWPEWMVVFGNIQHLQNFCILYRSSSLNVILPLFDNFKLPSLASSNECWFLKFLIDALCLHVPSCNATCELPLPLILKFNLEAAPYTEYMFSLTGWC